MDTPLTDGIELMQAHFFDAVGRERRAHARFTSSEPGTPDHEDAKALLLRARDATDQAALDAGVGAKRAVPGARVFTGLLPIHATVRESEAQLLAATDAANLGIWDLHLATNTLVASKHCKSNFGRAIQLPFSYEELQQAVHADDQERMRAAVAHTVATGDDYDIEYRINRPDGRLAWVRIHGRVRYDEEGHPASITGISQDITDVMLSRRRMQTLSALDHDVFGVIRDPEEVAYRAAEALGRALDVSRAGYGTIDKIAETITIERDWNAPGIRTLASVLHFRDYGTYIEDLKRGETVMFSDARTVTTLNAAPIRR